MDDATQKNHLKAYGITYWALDKQYKASWLLNYRGGSFLLPDVPEIRKECQIRGVSFEVISDGEMQSVLEDISSPSQNMETVVLEKAPKIAVYSPPGKQPWDDAVTMVLTYAEIPFKVVYDEEVLGDQLLLYDWLHLHHEDFTGQYGKFYGAYRNAPWYIEQKRDAEALAAKLGFSKVSQDKLAVAKKIRDFVIGVLCLRCALLPIALILLWQPKVLIFASLCLMAMTAMRIINPKSIILKRLPLRILF